MRSSARGASRAAVRLAVLLAALLEESGFGQQPASLADQVRAYLWSEDATAAREAESALAGDAFLGSLSRLQFHDLEEVLRRGRTEYPPPPAVSEGAFPLEEISVVLPDDRSMPLLVQLPPHYSVATAWPMLLAMHGGPPGRVEQARGGAERMIRVWKEAAGEAGWIVVSPVMTTVVAVAPRTEERLPYEVLRPEQMEAILSVVARRYRIDANRIDSTGISLGSNFSIAFACARPDRFAAIVPVSTEGDSRELLLRNLMHVPVYVLEGTQDKNIRTISGPNALERILTRFGYDLTYREFGDRAHEGFQEHYPDVLRWLADRPRQVYPREVLRVPHPAIMPVARRVHWVEADSRQALLRAKVAGDNRIEVTARWAREIRIYLHDRLVDLDREVEVWVNGTRAHRGKVNRSLRFALDQVRQLDDPGRIYAGALTVPVPSTAASLEAARALANALTPVHPEGMLSFWETYATRALEERLPSLGLEGEEVANPASLGLSGEQAAIRLTGVSEENAFGKAGVRVGDILLEVGGEPFYAGRGLVFLHAWLMRELTGSPRRYPVVVLRNGARHELSVELALGPYQDAGPP